MRSTNPRLKWQLQRELDTEKLNNAGKLATCVLDEDEDVCGAWLGSGDTAVCSRRFACIKVYKQKSIAGGNSSSGLAAMSLAS